jgi:hypothetical protein
MAAMIVAAYLGGFLGLSLLFLAIGLFIAYRWYDGSEGAVTLAYVLSSVWPIAIPLVPVVLLVGLVDMGIERLASRK